MMLILDLVINRTKLMFTKDCKTEFGVQLRKGIK